MAEWEILVDDLPPDTTEYDDPDAAEDGTYEYRVKAVNDSGDSPYSNVAEYSLSPWWQVEGKTCVAAYQPIGADDLADSYINLANPGTYDAAPGVAPGFDTASGWDFDATTARLDTGIQTDSGDWSVLIRLDIDGRGGNEWGRAVEGDDSTNIFLLIPNASGNVRQYENGTENIQLGGGQTGAHVMGFAGNQPYLDGSSDGASMASTAACSANIFIGNKSDGSRGLDGRVQAYAIYSDTLTAAEVAALTTAMNAL